MPSFLNLNQHEGAAAVAAVPAGEIATPDEEMGGAVAPAASSSPPASPTTSGAPSAARSKERRRLFLPMPTTMGGANAKSTFGNGRPILTPISPSIRTIALLAFGFLAVLLCSVTISHLAIAAPSKTVTTVSDGQSLPSLPVQQMPAHQIPTPSLSDQLDALRSSVAQLQNAIAEMQQQKSPSEPMAEAQIWAPPPNYLMDAPRMPLARRQLAWQPMKRMAWQPMKRMVFPSPPNQIQWQPVKRNSPNGGTIGGESAAGNAIDPKEQVILAIEQQLVEVLKAGEALGISAEQILTHLRARNGVGLGATFYG